MTVEAAAPKPVEFVRVPTDVVHPNTWNPNVMDEETFNALAEDVGNEDLDQPVIVIAHPQKMGEFMIVDGEHRWRAAKVKGLDEIPVAVRLYTEAESMAITMRRNVLRGQTDPKRFTLLVNRMKQQGLPISQIQKMMAVKEQDFTKLYRQVTEGDKDVATKAQEASEKTTQVATAVANLSTMVRELMLEYGDTIPSGFIAFMYKGQKCMMFSMNDKLRKSVEQFAAVAKDAKTPGDTVAELLAKALDDTLDSMD